MEWISLIHNDHVSGVLQTRDHQLSLSTSLLTRPSQLVSPTGLFVGVVFVCADFVLHHPQYACRCLVRGRHRDGPERAGEDV